MKANNLTSAVIGGLNLAAVIHDLKPTKPTAKGQERWRFSVSADIWGWTVGTTGWTYLPHAKVGYRVNPPRRGPVREITGVGLDLVQALERAVEYKLARGVKDAHNKDRTPPKNTNEYTPEELEELEDLGVRGEL